MRTGDGAAGEYNCIKCGEGVSKERPGCTALEQTFHVACFTCSVCGNALAGASFYNVSGMPMCDRDYQNTLEKCAGCGQAIAERLLRASGKAFHPNCFVCKVCNKSLDSVPFTVDPENVVHCVPCYQDKYAPRCAKCGKAIVPQQGEQESVRVIAMDRSFHVACYTCEDCHVQLSTKLDGEGCYPMDDHLLCKTCNVNRIRGL